MRATIASLAVLAMLPAAAAAQPQGTDSGFPLFGMPLQNDNAARDTFKRLPYRDLAAEIRIELAADILFDFDHGQVRASAQDYMQQIANLIFDRSNGQVRIECRLDRGVPAASQKLAQRCAAAIQDWLIKQEKLTRVRFTSTGFGVQPSPPPNPNDPFAQSPPSRTILSIVFVKR
jgi:outer membrane protein OmpA-like peptidoglycan-associated protein